MTFDAEGFEETISDAMSDFKSCSVCGDALPPDAHALTRYCSDGCRKSAKAKRQNDRIASTRCLGCQSTTPPGVRYCLACADDATAEAKNRYTRRVAEGRCTACGKKSYGGNVFCGSCASNGTDATKRRYYQRKSAGLCTECGGKRDTDKLKCAECTDRLNGRGRAWRNAKTANGICLLCDEPKMPEANYCKGCLTAIKEKGRNDYHRNYTQMTDAMLERECYIVFGRKGLFVYEADRRDEIEFDHIIVKSRLAALGCPPRLLAKRPKNISNFHLIYGSLNRKRGNARLSTWMVANNWPQEAIDHARKLEAGAMAWLRSEWRDDLTWNEIYGTTA